MIQKTNYKTYTYTYMNKDICCSSVRRSAAALQAPQPASAATRPGTSARRGGPEPSTRSVWPVEGSSDDTATRAQLRDAPGEAPDHGGSLRRARAGQRRCIAMQPISRYGPAQCDNARAGGAVGAAETFVRILGEQP